MTESTTLHEYERRVSEGQAQNDYWAQTRRSILEDWITDINPEYLLDVGCGSAYLADYFSKFIKSANGIDANRESIRIANDRTGIDSAIIGDAKRLPYQDSVFDCVFLADVIEHFEDPAPVLKECYRVLTHDGVIFISVPAFRWLWGPHDEQNDHLDRYTINRLSRIIEDTGFSLNRHRYTNFFPLPAYFILQRILKSGVPKGVRGSHWEPIEIVKRVLVSVERSISFPVGITLIAEYART